MHTLILTFKAADDKTTTLRLPNVSEPISADLAAEIASDIASANMFSQQGRALYVTPIKAQLVTTTTTQLFTKA